MARFSRRCRSVVIEFIPAFWYAKTISTCRPLPVSMARSATSAHRGTTDQSRRRIPAPPSLAGFEHEPESNVSLGGGTRTLTPWLTPSSAVEALSEMTVDSDGVDVATLQQRLQQLPATARVTIGGTPTPVLYVWTRRPASVRVLAESAKSGWQAAVEAVTSDAPAAGGDRVASSSLTSTVRRLLPGVRGEYELCRVAWSVKME